MTLPTIEPAFFDSFILKKGSTTQLRSIAFCVFNNTVSFLLVGIVLLVLVCCIALAFFLFQRGKRRKLLADQLSCKLREEALDQALVNLHAPAGRNIPDPVQVQYNAEAERKGGGPLLRLTEHSLTATRIYLLDFGQRLFLGTIDGQTIVRRDYVPKSGILCELYQSQHVLVARGLAAGVRLQRGRTTSPLGHEGIALRTGDELLLPDTQFRVELI